MTSFTPINPNKKRFGQDKVPLAERERIAAKNRRRQRIAHQVASYEAQTERAPVTLPRLSIQDAE